ncbi:MAG: Asp-tRNA(Asn)/Glu-tRNA(Gln) amidotransferase subunit GatA [Gemmatimonadetes bacterium]|nr:Asp-tRNA(Asn)/Glu-tRNA(Gln) amidotransferase subunit GatA [Gemmatimonadota bacterium]
MTIHSVARETIARLQATASLNATLAWSEEAITRQAAELDATPAGPLSGMAIAIKDNIVTKDLPTTCASRILEGYVSPFEATAVTRLRTAGALLACKANLDEFAMGSSTEHSAYGRVLHPLDPERVPGGSSGGSAALVAAGVVPAALGSETGGSVRQPAAFCGVVGIKPSYGRVSRSGLVAFGSSLDCISPFGATVDDAARVLAAMSGADPLDATTHALPPLELADARTDLKGLTIGLPREYFPADLDPGIRAGCDRAIAALRDLGAHVREVSLPNTGAAVPAYYIVNPAEAAANLARYDGVRYGVRHVGPEGDLRALYRATRGRGFGAEVRRRILVGTFALSAGYADRYYARAQAARRMVAADFAQAFADGIDLLFTPTTPTPAFRAGEKLDDPVQMYLADVFVCPSSLAGVPAMSQPIGRSEGLPLGGQLIAPHLGEATMIAAARLLEAALDPVAEVR